MNPFGYERRTTMTRLTDIDEMIRCEDDPKERNILLILQCLTANQLSSARVLEALEKKISTYNEKLEEQLRTHGDKLDKHDGLVMQGKAVWWVISALFGAWSVVIVAAGSHAYATMTDLRDEVIKQSVMIPAITKALEEFAKNNTGRPEEMSAINDVKRIQHELNVLKNKRVIINSK